MAKPTKQRLNRYTIFSFFFFCGCTATVKLEILRPAEITLPNRIEKIAVVNRSLPDKSDKAFNIIEGVLTGEMIALDREASEECLRGFREVIGESQHYSAIPAGGATYRGTGTGIYPPPLRWEEVVNICKENNADALVALEVFDSDSKKNFETQTVQEKDPDGNVAPSTLHIASLRIAITTGWRIYDPQVKDILDEFRFTDEADYKVHSADAQEAISLIQLKEQAIMKNGYQSGRKYGFRTIPTWIYATRTYYTRGNENMIRAKNLVKKKDDWDGAAEIWKKEALNSDKKITARACYNMAVASEMQDKLDIAIEWARKSGKESGFVPAQNYIRILEGRKKDEKKLQEQRGGE